MDKMWIKQLLRGLFASLAFHQTKNRACIGSHPNVTGVRDSDHRFLSNRAVVYIHLLPQLEVAALEAQSPGPDIGDCANPVPFDLELPSRAVGWQQSRARDRGE